MDLTTWNQKNLDYEIETYPLFLPSLFHLHPWNQKNLDYEIETEHPWFILGEQS